MSAVSALFVLLFNPGLAFGQALTHGPIVGGVTSTTANVFIRTGTAATVELRYGTDPNLATFSISDSVVTGAANDFTFTIPLASLTAETRYYVNPVVNGVPQLKAPYPTFVTFPPVGSARDFNFVVLTDFKTLKNLRSTTETWTNAAAENPAFVFIGGDFDHRNPSTLDDKRAMFRELYDPNTPFMSGFVSSILRQFPIAHQWDDHDAGQNNIDRTYPDWDLSQQAFQEYIPTYPLPVVSPGIWQKFNYAQVDFFVLDCRSQRDPENDPDNADKSMLDGNNLGATGELQWLKDGLLNSSARWKVIFTSVVTNTTTKYPDGWAGYQNEWQALRDFINANQIRNVVFISGDLHLAAIDNGSASGFPEMCVPVPNGDRDGNCATGPEGQWSEGYYDATCAGYGLITVSQNPDRLILQDADEFGVIHVSYSVPYANPSPTPTPTPGLILTAAASVKTQGTQTFGVPLPLAGEPGVECRQTNGRHTLVFTFSENVVSGSASLTSGAGSIAGKPTFSGKTMAVNLVRVNDVQKITVTLMNVTSSSSDVLPNTAVSMNVLSGDVDGDGIVDAVDVSLTRGQLGKPLTGSNFREDVKTDGVINNNDGRTVSRAVGHSLP